MISFEIGVNNFLSCKTRGYYHQLYTGFNCEDNPDFVNFLKNTFGNTPIWLLKESMQKVIGILSDDIPKLVELENEKEWLCICVPRAKRETFYSDKQLLFRKAVSYAINNISGISDGTDCIVRELDTVTTHLKNAKNLGTYMNDGELPYPGITKKTCRINRDRIHNKNVILIDDIYTKNVNIDEDCIQALVDNGAGNVIFYSIGYTRRTV